MAIENQLAELTTAINALTETNKQLLAAYQSGAQIAQAAATDAPKTTRKSAKSKDATDATSSEQGANSAPVVEGDPAGTRYWVNAVDRAVYAERPGQPAPENQNFKISSAAEYLDKKAEFAVAETAAKNAQGAATTSQSTANSAPSATAQQGTASGASSAGNAPSFEDVTKELMALAKDPAHGSTAVKTIMAKVCPTATKVPDMAGKGLEQALMDAINALRNPTAAGAADPLFG